ncbi:MAG: SMC-Scp complex subunit ScpB [Coriobacteriales bacterium]|jgi:segregation and condensation protein B|nr:SMC-Scp complex subunit ScpB [Coriobacteriales bacterium]
MTRDTDTAVSLADDVDPANGALDAASAADTATSVTSSSIDFGLEAAIEALLFVSDEPVSAAALAKILDNSPSEVDTALISLAQRLEEEERGIQLREVAGGWRLYSHPAFHDLIERYVISWDTRSLSQAALEALAVIAYHQPTTRAGVNGIRGVNSDAVISSLVEKGLVRESGRDPGPGNAILYATTRAFLEKFGLKSLKDLPPLEDFAPDEESRSYIRARLSAGQSAFAPETEDAGEDGDRDTREDAFAGKGADTSEHASVGPEELDDVEEEDLEFVD